MSLKPSAEAKWFAIGEVLSDWKQDLSADEVLSEIMVMSDDVTPTVSFEDWDGDDLYNYVYGLAENLQRHINKRTTPAEHNHFVNSEAAQSAHDLYIALHALFTSADAYIEDGSWIENLETDLKHAKKQLKIHKQYERAL